MHSSLRQTFAAEVAARLPRLRALAAGEGDVVDDARRDAHTLGSSAIIVSEPEIARLAHEVELHLTDGPLAELITALEAYSA
jgi:HPt (histidine-containing phosphotransfer) domain-containing protein